MRLVRRTTLFVLALVSLFPLLLLYSRRGNYSQNAFVLKNEINAVRSQNRDMITKTDSSGQATTIQGRTKRPEQETMAGMARPSPRPKARQIRTILMSHMRSGSTFTGDLLQASPDVMYFYEPLQYTDDVDDMPRNTLTSIRSRVKKQFKNDTHLPETVDFTLDQLRCNLTGQNLRYMLETFLPKSRSFDDYRICIKRLRRPADQSACSQVAMKRCKQSRNVISKILRLRMWEVAELMARDPKLQIIHLVRDPRGIIMSRKTAHFPPKYINTTALCTRMNRDASLSIDLEKKNPGRILTVRYEDLAMSPINMAMKLFHHAGVNWTQQIADKVQDMTSPSDTAFIEYEYGTRRKNSAATAFNWRLKLPFKTAAEIQNHCEEMMKMYGYIAFWWHTQMLNLDFPSLRNNYTDKYYKGKYIPLPE